MLVERAHSLPPPPTQSRTGQCRGGSVAARGLLTTPSQAEREEGEGTGPPGGLRGGGGHGAAEFVTGTEGDHRVLRERRWGARTPLESQGVGIQGSPPGVCVVFCSHQSLRLPSDTPCLSFSLSFPLFVELFWGFPKPLGGQEPGGQPLGLGPPRCHRGLHHGLRAPDQHPPGGGLGLTGRVAEGGGESPSVPPQGKRGESCAIPQNWAGVCAQSVHH